MTVTVFRAPMILTGIISLFLSACVAPSNPPPATSKPTARAPGRTPTPPRTTQPVPRPQPSYPQTSYPPAAYPGSGSGGFNRPAPQLESELFELWRTFPGKTGVAVRRIDGNWSVSQRGNELFPQQSVSKLWVAMAIFDKIDRGLITLDDEVTIGMDDLTLFHQPIRARVLRDGVVHESVRSLLEQSMTKSDCTANDSLLRYVGGPEAVRAFFRAKGITNIRFGEGERLMQSAIAGVRWQQSMSLGNNFEKARALVPDSTRLNLLNAYVANPQDGAAPEALALALARLARGELLSPASTRQIMAIMERTTSGPNRLKAGVPGGWRFLHKTGTGQVFGPMQTGYNDIGIMTAPDGTRYAVVVMMGSTTASIPERMVMMQGVSRSVATWHSR